VRALPYGQHARMDTGHLLSGFTALSTAMHA
jgi:hypothetical protein